jgi:hypothetical protein
MNHLMSKTRFFLLMLAVLVLASCSHVNYLRDAQDTFNQAAGADNLYRYGDLELDDLNDAGPATDALTASAGYAAAIASIEALKGDAEAKGKLEADGLYGYALALQGLAYWRLGKWKPAEAASREAVATGHLGERDLALMNAMPGLIKNDQAYAALNAGSSRPACTSSNEFLSPTTQWELPMGNNASVTLACNASLISVRDQLAGALCDLDTARVGAPFGHPVRSYLALSQMAVVANIRSMCNVAKSGGMPPKFLTACSSETMRIGDCVAARYKDKPEGLVEAVFKETCGESSLRANDLVRSLIAKLGIDEAQLKSACP